MADDEEQRWDELLALYRNHNEDLSLRQSWIRHRLDGLRPIPAMENALRETGYLPLDGADNSAALEYEDAIAGNEIYEALKEG